MNSVLRVSSEVKQLSIDRSELKMIVCAPSTYTYMSDLAFQRAYPSPTAATTGADIITLSISLN